MALGERCFKRSDVRKSATVLSLIFFLLTLGWPIYDRTVPESERDSTRPGSNRPTDARGKRIAKQIINKR